MLVVCRMFLLPAKFYQEHQSKEFCILPHFITQNGIMLEHNLKSKMTHLFIAFHLFQVFQDLR